MSKMHGLFRTAAGTWHVIEVPDNVGLITFAQSVEVAVQQLNKEEGVEDPNEEMEMLISQVRAWLTEMDREQEGSRYRWCRMAKLEQLVKHGRVTASEAQDCWDLSEGH